MDTETAWPSPRNEGSSHNFPLSLSPFFYPQGIAVIGASRDPNKLGYGLARNLVQSNYQGVVHFVNPKGGKLLGRPVHLSIALVPDPLDLAILIIPAAAVPVALQDCGKRGLRAAIIASGGFRETGPTGAALEAECLRIARSYEMRLLGPNCVGLLDTHLPLDATFLPPPGPLPGDVAFISHSGAICTAVIDWARGQGFGLSRLVSLGNQADVNETDLLAPVAADPFTRVLTLYLEGVSDGRRFVQEASRVTRSKPVIALKVGRFDSGRRAVASHTGALAGQESAFAAAFRRAGVIRAETCEEMFDWGRALAWCPLPAGRAVAVLTDAGGPGVTAADALESGGLRLAELQAGTCQALRAELPAAASLLNPVDMLASASPEQYAACLRILLDDPGVQSALVILPPPPMYTAGAVAKALIPVIHASDKPVVIALMGERLIQEAVEHFRAARVPEYRFPERAASALSVLAQRAEFLAGEAVSTAESVALGESAGLRLNAETIASEEKPHLARPRLAKDTAAARRILEGQRHALQPGGWLAPEASQRLLAAYGLPSLSVRLARSAAEAAQLAEEVRLGDRRAAIALKVASPDIVHKTEVGGVLLNLRGEQAVRRGYRAILERVARAQPGAQILGVYVQRMLPAGQEVILGAVQDSQFGPLVMFGSGGIDVEGLKDVAFELAPLNWGAAGQMIDRTWAGQKLGGYRGLPAADRPAVQAAVVSLAELMLDFPDLFEIEINPLCVLSAGQGVLVVDARARFKEL